MSVLIAIPCLMLGGSELATLQMVKALIAGGMTVSVVCYYESDPKMAERYREAGARLIFLDERREGLKGMLRLLFRLTAFFRQEKPKVVHVQYFAPGMVPIVAARLAGIRNVFATVHAAGNKGYNWKAKTMFRFSAALTSHFFCVTKNTEHFWFSKTGSKRHSTIHNGIDVRAFSQAKAVSIPELKPEDCVIGIVGRVVKLKGHDCLFRAVKHLLPDIPALKVLVIGDGADRPFFEALARDLGIADRVIWTGRIEPESLAGYYKNMKLLAMPSHWEGFGLTAAEAMAAGVPVAASGVPGLCEVIGDAGLFFPVDDDAALANCILKILQDREEFSRNSTQRVVQYFSLPQQVLKWQEAYNSYVFN